MHCFCHRLSCVVFVTSSWPNNVISSEVIKVTLKCGGLTLTWCICLVRMISICKLNKYVWASALCIRFYGNPAPVTDPSNDIPVPLVTRQPEQTTLFFRSAACSVGLTSHGFTQPTGDSRCSPDSNLVSPLHILIACCLSTYSFLYTKPCVV